MTCSLSALYIHANVYHRLTKSATQTYSIALYFCKNNNDLTVMNTYTHTHTRVNTTALINAQKVKSYTKA